MWYRASAAHRLQIIRSLARQLQLFVSSCAVPQDARANRLDCVRHQLNHRHRDDSLVGANHWTGDYAHIRDQLAEYSGAQVPG